MSDIVDRDRIVRMFAADDDWCSPVNRTMSRMARSLLDAGVNTQVIYDALLAVGEPIRVN